MVIFKDFLMWKLNENIGKMGRLFLDGSYVQKARLSVHSCFNGDGQIMNFATPPSTFRADPLVPDDNGLAT